MIRQRAIQFMRNIFWASLLATLAGCTTVLYQASGQYEGADEQPREILLQWKAQRYFIPFVNADVDYGSISLQAECMPDIFLDHRNHADHGFVFVERPQDFALAEGAPDHRIGNFRICAMFVGNPSIEELSAADNASLQVLCVSRFDTPFLASNLGGYPLSIAESASERTLVCRADQGAR